MKEDEEYDVMIKVVNKENEKLKLKWEINEIVKV
jgi:hypothetical protein